MDAIRSIFRNLLGYRSVPYVLAANIAGLYYAFVREGLTGIKFVGMRHGSGKGVWMKFRHLAFPIYVRPGTADVDSIIDNLFREEYGRLPKHFSPRVVFDIGAYIGDTAAYFLSRFKDARVIAFEPNPESYALACDNLTEYGGRAELKRLAIWNSVGTVRFSGQQTGASISDDGFAIDTTTIPDVMRRLGIDYIDLMKMDIEGAELAVLKSGVDSWLRMVGILLLETHGKEIEDAAIPLLKKVGFCIRRHRNVWYCINQQVA